MTQPPSTPAGGLLSFSEQFLWRMVHDGAGVAFVECPFNLSTVLRLGNRLDVSALRRSIDEIVRRHAVLRSRFRETAGEPVRSVAPAGPVPWSEIDVRHVPASEQSAAVRTVLLDEARTPFDLETGPLLRVTLVRVGDDAHVLAITVHHIVFDGESRRVLVRELASLYGGFAAGQAPALPPLAATYDDYVAWQRARLPRDAEQRLIDAWTARLSGGADLRLPYDRPADGCAAGAPDVCRFLLDGGDLAALRAVGRASGATLGIVMLAVFAAVLHSLAGTGDILVGMPLSDRRRVAFEKVIGLFTNVMIVRIDLTGDPPFPEVVKRVRRALADAYAQQDLPYGCFVRARAGAAGQPLPPPFRVTFNFMAGGSEPPVPFPGLVVENIALGQPLPGLADLSLQLWDKGATLSCALSFNAALFSAHQAARLAAHLQSCARALVAAPQRAIGGLPAFLR